MSSRSFRLGHRRTSWIMEGPAGVRPRPGWAVHRPERPFRASPHCNSSRRDKTQEGSRSTTTRAKAAEGPGEVPGRRPLEEERRSAWVPSRSKADKERPVSDKSTSGAAYATTSRSALRANPFSNAREPNLRGHEVRERHAVGASRPRASRPKRARTRRRKRAETRATEHPPNAG